MFVIYGDLFSSFDFFNSYLLIFYRIIASWPKIGKVFDQIKQVRFLRTKKREREEEALDESDDELYLEGELLPTTTCVIYVFFR